MNDIKLSRTGQKKEHYLKALLVLHGIKLTEIAKKAGVDPGFVSFVVRGRRQGVKKQGRLIRQAVAEALGMKVEDFWPDKKG